LHNLYCQLHNFSQDFDTLIRLYPLERVREIHISGGSWEATVLNPERLIRRDTHDDTVPKEVFALLRKTIPLCPHLKYVVMEQMGAGLQSEESRKGFYDDFISMAAIVSANSKEQPTVNSFLPAIPPAFGPVVENMELYRQQLELSNILETALDYNDALRRLKCSSLATTDWHVERWQPYMVETAMNIAQKWCKKEI